MFLHIVPGVWYGNKGILVFVCGFFGLGWIMGYRARQDKEHGKMLLMYGIPKRKNLFHSIGDIWAAMKDILS